VADEEHKITAVPDQTSTGDADALVGTNIDGKIKIIQLLGRGSSGAVYQAHHQALDSMVAVKVLNATIEDPQIAKQRFMNEAQLLSQMQDEHIVKFHSYGVLGDGRNYMVLELLEGKTLQEILEEEEILSTPRALNIFKQISSGLSYAHAKGVIHRDIKPGNVMICNAANSEHVKILDFGIFKAMNSANQNLTKTGVALGSVNYMSPEQCKNEELDARSDLYSLACLMYECLVGQPPMKDVNDLVILSNHVNKTVSDVPSKDSIPNELKKIILKCLEKEPDKRFENASKLLEALQGCSDIGTESSKFKKRNLFSPISISALLSILLIGGASIIFFSARKTAEFPLNDSDLTYSDRKRPESVSSMEKLQIAERWLMKRLKRISHSSEVNEAAMVYSDCVHFRTIMRLPPNTDLWEAVEHMLNSDKLQGSNEWSVHHHQLILAYVVRGEHEKMKNEIAKFTQKVSAKETDAMFQAAVRIAKVQNDTATLTQLVQLFQAYAQKRKIPLVNATSDMVRAEMLFFTGQIPECVKLLPKLKQEIDRTRDDDKSSLEELNARYMVLLNCCGFFSETIELVNKEYPDIADLGVLRKDSERIDLAMVALKLAAAEAFAARKRLDKANDILNRLLEQEFQEVPESQFTDAVEQKLIRLTALYGDRSLILPMVSKYLQRVYNVCPQRIDVSLEFLIVTVSENPPFPDLSEAFQSLLQLVPDSDSATKGMIRRRFLQYLDTAGDPHNNGPVLIQDIFEAIDLAKDDPDFIVAVSSRYALTCIQSERMATAWTALEKAKPFLGRCCANNKFTWEFYRALYELDSTKNPDDGLNMLKVVYEQCRNTDIGMIDSFHACAMSLSRAYIKQAKYAEAEEILVTALEKTKRYRPKNTIEIREFLDTLAQVYDRENKQTDKQKCLDEIKAL
jgi:serine/threonine protein kinase